MSTQLMNGATMLLECLVREGVECIFGYPGGVTLPFYDALYDHPIRHVLVRHEENAAFAAEGYARATGKVGVCCATSGPGATNLVTGLVDAMMDSIPIVALTGQVSTKLIGSDAFQEADTFGITRSCTKHNYLVKKLEDLPAVIHEAFYLAASGRPGPVLVDIPKDVFQGKGHYQPVGAIHLPGYKVFTEGHAGQIRRAAHMIWESTKPMVYAGGGIIAANASEELREFVELTDFPAVNTLMGLGALPAEHPNFISMPGMHGSYAANMGMYNTDLLIALGVRFDDRVTGRLAAFAPHAKIIHVDIDPAEIGKIRQPDLPIVGDVKRVLQKLNKLVAELKPELAPLHAAARRSGGTKSKAGRSNTRWPRCTRIQRSSRSIWWRKSTGCPAAGRLCAPTSASIRCGPPNWCASTNRGCGSTPGGWARWVSACPPPSARSSRGRTSWCSRWWATAVFKCRFPNWPPSPLTACR